MPRGASAHDRLSRWVDQAGGALGSMRQHASDFERGLPLTESERAAARWAGAGALAFLLICCCAMCASGGGTRAGRGAQPAQPSRKGARRPQPSPLAPPRSHGARAYASPRTPRRTGAARGVDEGAQLAALRRAAAELRVSRARLGSSLRVNVADGLLFEIGLRLSKEADGLHLDERWLPCAAISHAHAGWPSAGGCEPHHPTVCFEIVAYANPIRFVARSSGEALQWLAVLHESPLTAIGRRKSVAQLGFSRLRLMWERAVLRQDEALRGLGAGDDGVRDDLLAGQLRSIVVAADARGY